MRHRKNTASQQKKYKSNILSLHPLILIPNHSDKQHHKLPVFRKESSEQRFLPAGCNEPALHSRQISRLSNDPCRSSLSSLSARVAVEQYFPRVAQVR